MFCNESSVCRVWKFGLFWLCYVASVCWVDICRCCNDHEICIRVCFLCIQCCGQVKFFLCQVILDILVLNRRLPVINQLNLLRDDIHSRNMMVLAQQCSNGKANVACAGHCNFQILKLSHRYIPLIIYKILHTTQRASAGQFSSLHSVWIQSLAPVRSYPHRSLPHPPAAWEPAPCTPRSHNPPATHPHESVSCRMVTKSNSFSGWLLPIKPAAPVISIVLPFNSTLLILRNSNLHYKNLFTFFFLCF